MRSTPEPDALLDRARRYVAQRLLDTWGASDGAATAHGNHSISGSPNQHAVRARLKLEVAEAWAQRDYPAARDSAERLHDAALDAVTAQGFSTVNLAFADAADADLFLATTADGGLPNPQRLDRILATATRSSLNRSETTYRAALLSATRHFAAGDNARAHHSLRVTVRSQIDGLQLAAVNGEGPILAAELASALDEHEWASDAMESLIAAMGQVVFDPGHFDQLDHTDLAERIGMPAVASDASLQFAALGERLNHFCRRWGGNTNIDPYLATLDDLTLGSVQSLFSRGADVADRAGAHQQAVTWRETARSATRALAARSRVGR